MREGLLTPQLCPFATLHMIHWLIQTQAAHSDLARGVPPVGLLSGVETAVFNALITEKRRRDWLLGRWTAKQLIQAVVKQEKGEEIALQDFSILAGTDGAPEINSQLPMVSGQWSISISHARDVAFCALVQRPSWPLGVDIEWIEPRSKRFVADYFTAAEQEMIAQADLDKRSLDKHSLDKQSLDKQSLLVTAVWSAKEAALKAIHQGLKVDTRCVSCLPHLQTIDDEWQSIAVQWDTKRIRNAPALQGWWRPYQNFVLTMTARV